MGDAEKAIHPRFCNEFPRTSVSRVEGVSLESVRAANEKCARLFNRFCIAERQNFANRWILSLDHRNRLKGRAQLLSAVLRWATMWPNSSEGEDLISENALLDTQSRVSRDR